MAGLATDGSTVTRGGAATISGTFTGNGSTLLSSYSGTGTITYAFSDGSTETDTYSATCAAGVLAVCPFVGTITSSPGGRTGATLELTPQTAAINPLASYSSIDYLEIAGTFICPPAVCSIK